MANSVAVDRVFYALADPTRRHILDELGSNGPRSASALAAQADISRQAIAKHLTIMTEAGLVQRSRAGREVVFTVDAHQFAATGRWMQRIAQRWENAHTVRESRASLPFTKSEAATTSVSA